jgi:hypothetical protein
MMDFSNMFGDSSFLDPQDPYKLALVKSGQKRGQLVYDLDEEEVKQWGILPSQGRSKLEAKLIDLHLPYFTREEQQQLNEEYNNAEVTVYGFYVASSSEWVRRFDQRLEDGSNCFDLGDFQGYPDCCVSTFCEDKPAYLHGHSDYLDAVDAYVSSNEMDEQEARLLAVLPDISHYPCMFSCEESIDIAEESMSFFDTEYSEASKYYHNLADQQVANMETSLN